MGVAGTLCPPELDREGSRRGDSGSFCPRKHQVLNQGLRNQHGCLTQQTVRSLRGLSLPGLNTNSVSYTCGSLFSLPWHVVSFPPNTYWLTLSPQFALCSMSTGLNSTVERVQASESALSLNLILHHLFSSCMTSCTLLNLWVSISSPIKWN